MTNTDQALAYKLQPYLLSALELKRRGLISLPTTNSQGRAKPPWVDPPAGAQAFQYFQTAALQLGNALSGVQVVLVFQVPPGRSGVITQLANQIVGGGMTEATGDVIWQVLVDGFPIQGYDAIINCLGTAAVPGDLKDRRQIILSENQTVQLTVNNIAVAGNPPVAGMLAGYYWPLSQQDESLWL